MKNSTRDMALVSLFTGLTAIGAFISIPVGPVSNTLQTLFVLLGLVRISHWEQTLMTYSLFIMIFLIPFKTVTIAIKKHIYNVL